MRSSGILMHISSLPSPYGIGSLGSPARDFIDFLKAAGQTYWQILPICPTGYGDSPYQSFSTFAGNPYFIDLEELEKMGLLLGEDYHDVDWESPEDKVNYGALYQKRYPILKLAAERFLQKIPADYQDFCRENEFWLEDYALFMALKEAHGDLSWTGWENGLRYREPEVLQAAKETYSSRMDFWKVVQYLFFAQWKQMKAYANDNGISIIGDLPIYVSFDSVDVWAHPDLFQLDENLMPIEVAGCPPDGFSADGQLWGNPLFDWERMEKDGYRWWVKRITYQCSVYDVLRIDHFRGFDSYFAIPYGAPTAAGGHWKQGPGMKLFRVLEEQAGRQNIIAEDLGFLTESVRQLLKDSGFPGMKVYELGFDKRDATSSDYLTHNFIPHCIAYTGTHDNDTIQGWFHTADAQDAAYAVEYLGLHDPENYHWEMMKALWISVAETTVVQAQDLLGLGSEARMNTPSTSGSNWCWRALPGSFSQELAQKLYGYMKLYQRIL